MAEEKKEPWLNYLALTTVIFAVCATLSTFKGSSFSTRSVMSQSKASNQWAFYQSKSIKEYLYEIQKDILELQTKNPNLQQDLSLDIYKKKVEEYSQQIIRYQAEKSKIQEEAKNFENIRDEAQIHSQRFGIAVIFLQISILLSSIAALLKKKPVWYLGIIVGVTGIVYFINGFMLFF